MPATTPEAQALLEFEWKRISAGWKPRTEDETLPKSCQEYAGNQAVLDGDGRDFDKIAGERLAVAV